MTTPNLYELLNLHEWSEIVLHLTSDSISQSELSTPFKDDMLPLHVACKQRAPDFVVLELIRKYEDAVWTKCKLGNLPLHIAAEKNSSPDVVEALIRVFPEGLDVENDSGVTPRDYGHSSPHVSQILRRPTRCWLQLMEDETRETNEEVRMEKIQNDVADSLRHISASNSNLDDILSRLQNAQKKLNWLDHQSDEKAENLVRRVEKETNKSVNMMENHLVALENDFEATVAKEFMSKAALCVRENELVRKQAKSAVSVKKLWRDIEKLKVTAQVEKALDNVEAMKSES